jgi:hypothetical protein
MLSVSRISGTYEVRWGLTGTVIYRGTDEAMMADAIKTAFDELGKRMK